MGCDELEFELNISLGDAQEGLLGLGTKASEFLTVLEQNMISYREIVGKTIPSARMHEFCWMDLVHCGFVDVAQNGKIKTDMNKVFVNSRQIMPIDNRRIGGLQ